VTVGRLMVAGDTVIAASQGGKIKTALQVGAVVAFLWPGAPGWVDVVGYILLIAAVLVALVTGYDYMRRIATARKHHRAERSTGTQGTRPDVAA
jgi:CDP-diacylglycerol--glycerol-3-phosphate 3-phosphatidyltransferase